jgi:hypothetical protein
MQHVIKKKKKRGLWPKLAIRHGHVRYYHEDRTHLGLWKGTPDYRIRSTASGRVLSQDRLGGLHHRYVRAA